MSKGKKQNGKGREPSRKAITEKDDVHKKWYAFRPKNLEEAFTFAQGLLDEYKHDYGTIVHATAASMVAVMRGMDKADQGGLTGFQASLVWWQLAHHLLVMADGPMRLIRTEEMLYPQYADKFARRISTAEWTWLKEQAEKLLADRESSVEVRNHWQSIVEGHVPFGYTVKDE